MRPLTEEETKSVFESTSTTVGDSRAGAGHWYLELANYIGKNLVHLIDRDEDDAYCFRLHKDRYVWLFLRGRVVETMEQGEQRWYMRGGLRKQREKGMRRREEGARVQGLKLITRVYYLPVAMLHLATSVARSNLISLGTCFGKFSKTGKFKLGITSLDWLAKYAKYKVRYSPLFLFHHAVQRPGGIYQDAADFRYG